MNTVTAAYHHDIGKPHVKSFTNIHGESTSDAHFYGHESVSSYMWLSSHDAQLLDSEDVFRIGSLIQWHMMPYFLTPKGDPSSREALNEWGNRRNFSEEFLNQLWSIHEADQSAH
jgi:hypothetical protein